MLAGHYYNGGLSPNRKRWAVLGACAALLAGLASALLTWALSVPHRPLELVVAGSLATAIALVAAFCFLLSRGIIGGSRAVRPDPAALSSKDP